MKSIVLNRRFTKQEQDYSIRFYNDGSIKITDNEIEEDVQVSELSGAAYDFYAKHRLSYIKDMLNE